MRTTRSTRGTPPKWYRLRGACAGFGTASIRQGGRLHRRARQACVRLALGLALRRDDARRHDRTRASGGDIRFIAYDHPPSHPDPFLYWSEYACHVVSNGNLYFRSCDGAIMALTTGQPTAAVRWRPEVAHAPQPTPRDAPPVISHLQAREYAGCTTRVEGELRHIVNNGKQVLLGFHSPHQGYFKVLIPKAHWAQFGGAPDRRYRIGQRVRVSGAIAWYQGDPAVYARAPEQIEVG
jgi:hypothetical protein